MKAQDPIIPIIQKAIIPQEYQGIIILKPQEELEENFLIKMIHIYWIMKILKLKI